jgi:hypothetical protein
MNSHLKQVDYLIKVGEESRVWSSAGAADASTAMEVEL